MRKIRIKGFTLAEVLITLAIIGVVAALAIPSVISNSQQMEYKTGLRKAVSVLNSAIAMGKAIDGESPYDNANLFGYMYRHMSVLRTTSRAELDYYIIYPGDGSSWKNTAFYTTDGMKFEFRRGRTQADFPLYENPSVNVCTLAESGDFNQYGGESPGGSCGGCGSYGLNNNPDGTTKPPCLIMVDVNGDRGPNPANAHCLEAECSSPYKFSTPDGSRLTDMFTIMITDKEAIPYGTAAQKAMYGGRK